MINRIRAIRKDKGMTLAQVAAACNPPTTAQTIGRLETGMRNLSLDWMNRIAAALGVAPELLLRGEESEPAMIVARLSTGGTEALPKARDAIAPAALAGEGGWSVIEVESSMGEYRLGDQIWLREIDAAEHGRLVNRDVLVPRSRGRYAFGRLIDRDASRVAILPPGAGQRQVIVEKPEWLAAAEMLLRKL